jgi:hypothetical protein
MGKPGDEMVFKIGQPGPPPKVLQIGCLSFHKSHLPQGSPGTSEHE